jgi:hypothetical protein
MNVFFIVFDDDQGSNYVAEELSHAQFPDGLAFSKVDVNVENHQLLGAFVKLRKAIISFVMSVCPTVRMEQLASHWKEFRET